MANPKNVPTGNGLLKRARDLLIGRKRKLDEDIEKMERGENPNSKKKATIR